MNNFFREYIEGRNIDEIVKDIVDIYDGNCLKEGINIGFFTDFKVAKDQIVYKLINYKKNEKLLEKIPHVKYLDLAIVFYYLISEDRFKNATILVYNTHIEMWKTDLKTIYKCAKKNAPRLLEAELNNIKDIIGNFMDIELVEQNCGQLDETQGVFDIPMYVLTNKFKLNGAATILYNNVLKSFADKINDDLYVLPSSIHEGATR